MIFLEDHKQFEHRKRRTCFKSCRREFRNKHNNNYWCFHLRHSLVNFARSVESTPSKEYFIKRLCLGHSFMLVVFVEKISWTSTISKSCTYYGLGKLFCYVVINSHNNHIWSLVSQHLASENHFEYQFLLNASAVRWLLDKPLFLPCGLNGKTY